MRNCHLQDPRFHGLRAPMDWRRPVVARRAALNDAHQRLLELRRAPETRFDAERLGGGYPAYYELRGYRPENRAASSCALST